MSNTVRLDIGIVGEDTILEEQRKLYEVLGSWIRKMPDVRRRTTVCGRTSETSGADPCGKLKYPHIAKDYFYNKTPDSRNRQTERFDRSWHRSSDFPM